MKVYFIPGLGANKRAFDHLDLSWCEPVFIDWQTPGPNETLVQYAHRLRASIEEKKPVIVGVSFGGMLVTEMAKADPGIKAIIISSNKLSKEFPAYLRMWRHFPVYKWVSPDVMRFTGRFTRLLIGPQGLAQRQTFKQILNDTNPVFTAWVIDVILNWQNDVVPANLCHIHGSGDRLLPMRFTVPHHIIKGGKHIMIMDKAAEVSALLKELIKTDIAD